jgi:protein TonB
MTGATERLRPEARPPAVGGHGREFAGVPPKGLRYEGAKRSRGWTWLALTLSAGIHVGILFGFRRPPPAPKPTVVDTTPAIAIVMPELKDLDEPDPRLEDPGEQAQDLGALVPSLPDVPSHVDVNDFVQPIDVTTLMPKPDLKAEARVVIPTNFRRGGPIGEGLKDVFNLADLDRGPTPILQRSPIFPAMLKREVDYAEVTVQFIVDKTGGVINAQSVSSTHAGFEDAAVVGVSKWTFKPGTKLGRKVNTRMQVTIKFRLEEND